jgi:predicted MFS family arabinose efflux permease
VPQPNAAALRNLMITVAAMGLAGTVFSSVMPDLLHNQLGVEGRVRGALEVPRELPGLLQIALVALLAGLAKSRSLTLTFVVGCAAFVGLSFVGDSLPLFVVFMVLWSASAHTFMPFRDAVAMELAGNERRGWILGTAGAFRAIGLIVGTGLVWLVLTKLALGFRALFLITAATLVLGVLASERLPLLASDRPADGEAKRNAPRLFVDLLTRRPEYRLYYLLSALFGARKQIFLTFAPWLLVSSYGQKAPQLALGFGISAAVGILLRPLLGRWIDHSGERSVIVAESAMVAVMCAAYAVVPLVAPRGVAVVVLYGLYVLDDILFFLYIARTTYLSRISRSVREVAPAVALGGTIDHVASMLVPLGAGIMWTAIGPWSVFLAAAAIALASLIAAFALPRERRDNVPVGNR